MRASQKRVSSIGFTLLELLLAFGVFALIGTIILSTLVQTAKTSRAATAYSNTLKEQVGCLQLLRKELFHVKPSGFASAVSSQQRSVANRPWVRFYTYAGSKGVIEVAYRLVEVEGQLVFQRREFPNPSGSQFQEEFFQHGSLGVWKTVCHSVTGWSVEFSENGQTYKNNWDSVATPQVIKLNFEFTEKMSSGTEKVHQREVMVYPVAGTHRWQ